jgi:hypothetical protein
LAWTHSPEWASLPSATLGCPGEPMPSDVKFTGCILARNNTDVTPSLHHVRSTCVNSPSVIITDHRYFSLLSSRAFTLSGLTFSSLVHYFLHRVRDRRVVSRVHTWAPGSDVLPCFSSIAYWRGCLSPTLLLASLSSIRWL